MVRQHTHHGPAVSVWTSAGMIETQCVYPLLARLLFEVLCIYICTTKQYLFTLYVHVHVDTRVHVDVHVDIHVDV